MSLKTAAFFALVGMILLTVLDLLGFLRDLSALGHDAIAVNAVIASAIHLFAALTVAIFFLAFFRSQS